MYPEWLENWNTFAWVAANCLIAYTAVALIVFVVGYYVLFDPKATTAGKFVFRFALSLVGVIALVFIGIFVDPTAGRTWATYNGDYVWWRPTVRLLIYGYVAFTITGLSVLLWIRKFRPHLIRTAADSQLVKPRHDTNPIPIFKHHD